MNSPSLHQFIQKAVTSMTFRSCPLFLEANLSFALLSGIQSKSKNPRPAEFEKTTVMKALRHPGVLSGLFVAATVTIALIGILFFGWKVAGLPFVPFDVFDQLTRVLPGRVIASGIGTMVTVIRALNLGPTAETAKTAEQVMAIAGLFVAGVVAGVILFAIGDSVEHRIFLPVTEKRWLPPYAAQPPSRAVNPGCNSVQSRPWPPSIERACERRKLSIRFQCESVFLVLTSQCTSFCSCDHVEFFVPFLYRCFGKGAFLAS
jgi:F0F1-type ATP synthase assembly protein I